LEHEFLLGTLRRLWERLEQRQPLREVRDGFALCRPAPGFVGGLVEIRDGALGVPPPLKVHRQLRRDVSCLDTIARFRTPTDLLVQVDTPCCGQPAVEHLLIERVHETIASRYCPVWPGLLPTRVQELAPPRQGCAPFVNPHHVVS
jgi:hypothetical protein